MAEKIVFKKCRLCGDKTSTVFNIDFKKTPICDPCASAVFAQQATWLHENNHILLEALKNKK